jgi:rSAM/selenodomain-associated transferase 2
MVSIIIPAYNEEVHLSNLLPYLCNDLKSKADMEVIVSVSPNTTDRTVDCHQHDQLRFLVCKKQGRACQMNEGAMLAKGTILVFLHADVWPPINFVENILSTLNEGFEAGFFSYRFNKSSFLLKANASFTRKDGIFTGGGDQCLFIRNEIFNKLGGFNEAQVLMEDFEFFNRMKQAKVPYKIVKNDLVVSARKYERNSYLRVNLTNLLLVLLFKLGIPAERLKGLHNKLLRMPYPKNQE